MLHCSANTFLYSFKQVGYTYRIYRELVRELKEGEMGKGKERGEESKAFIELGRWISKGEEVEEEEVQSCVAAEDRPK